MANAMAQADRALEENRRVLDRISQGTMVEPSPLTMAQANEVLSRTNTFNAPTEEEYRRITEVFYRANADSAEVNAGGMARTLESLYAAQVRANVQRSIDEAVLNLSETQTGRMTSGGTLTPTGELNPNMGMPETLAASLQAVTDRSPRVLARSIVAHSRLYAEALRQELLRELGEDEEEPPF